VAAATETETAWTAEAAADGWRRHRQWCRRKHRVNNDGNNRQRRLQCWPGIASLSTTATGMMTSITMTTTAAVTTKTIMTTTVRRGVAEAVLKTEPAAAAETRGGRGGASGKGEGIQQSTKSSKNVDGGNSGGQEAPGKRREAAGAAGVVAGAMAAAAAAVAATVVAMAVGERPEAREESNVIGVPRILLGNNLVKNRAMRLVNAYPEDPNVWHLLRLLSVPQIDLSAFADRKMVIFYVYLRYFTKKSQLYRTDMQIKK
jgi:hypothetical protein